MTPEQVRADYRGAMGRVGETVTLRRESDDPATVSNGVLARVVGFTAQELASGIDQGARKLIVLAEDVEREITAGRWPAPAGGQAAILKNDIIIVRGAPLSVESVDDSTRRVAGVLVAYEIVATG